MLCILSFLQMRRNVKKVNNILAILWSFLMQQVSLYFNTKTPGKQVSKYIVSVYPFRSFKIKRTFWCIFGGIWAITWRMLVQELEVYLHEHGLSRNPTKKPNGVKWSWWPVDIVTTSNVSCNKAIFARVVLHVAPSCWNLIFSR